MRWFQQRNSTAKVNSSSLRSICLFFSTMGKSFKDIDDSDDRHDTAFDRQVSNEEAPDTVDYHKRTVGLWSAVFLIFNRIIGTG